MIFGFTINTNAASYTDASYNLTTDGYITTVKNQLTTGTCWAHAAVASIESNLLKKSAKATSLSPIHLELATQNTLYIPGRTTFNRTVDIGGDHYAVAAPYFLNYWGPINTKSQYSVENFISYLGSPPNLANTVENEKATYNVNDIFYMLNNSCDTNAKTAVKKYIVTNGALVASMYYTDTSLKGYYYNYTGATATNHAVNIIGWDDSVSKTNFTPQPASDGAWIVRNSWGTSFGNQGNIYISYEDAKICTSLTGYYNVDENVSANAYYYDDLGWIAQQSADSSTVYLANLYPKKTSKTEKIDKVTFGTITGVNYTIYYSPDGNLNNYASNVLASGITDHNGYTTVKINNINITNDKFGIIIKFTNPSGSNVRYPSTSKMEGILSTTPFTSEASFLSSDGSAWTDTAATSLAVTAKHMNAIRVYTSPVNSISLTAAESNEADVAISNPQTGLESYPLLFASSLVGSFYILIKVRKKSYY